eukprot:3300965-Rhodomonas_salina.1
MPPGLRQGQTVELHSLRAAQEHNGKLAVVDCMTKAGRLQVKLAGTGHVLAVKPDNVRPAQMQKTEVPPPPLDDGESCSVL